MSTPIKQDERVTKSFPAFIVDTKMSDNGDLGIVSAIVSVMGNIDHHEEVITNGAFIKTIAERWQKIRVLDNHNFWSAEDAIAKLLTIREVGKAELPPELLMKYPDATGGLYIECQFMLDEPTDKSAKIFRRIKAGLIDEYSIGFQIIKSDWRTVQTDMGEREIRFITEIKLYEFSPVIFAANDATVTVGAKDNNPDIENTETSIGMGTITAIGGDVSEIVTPIDTVIPHSKAIPGYEQSVGDNACKSCKFYKAVTEKSGYCTMHDEAVKDKYTCDTFEVLKLAETIGSHFKSALMKLIDEQTTKYAQLGVLSDDDVLSLSDLMPVVIESMLALMPQDVLGRELPDNTMTMPKSDELSEAEPVKGLLTSDAERVQLESRRRIAELKAMQIRHRN